MVISQLRMRSGPKQVLHNTDSRTAVWGLSSDQIDSQNRTSAWELSLAHTSGGLAGGDSPVCGLDNKLLLGMASVCESLRTPAIVVHRHKGYPDSWDSQLEIGAFQFMIDFA